MQVFGLTILAPPPPSSAAVIIAALHILQGVFHALTLADLQNLMRAATFLREKPTSRNWPCRWQQGKGGWLSAGYSQPLSFMGPLASHLQVEAMKSAFALRTHLGDPGACSNSSNCFLDLEALLNDTLSLDFADSLRYAPSTWNYHCRGCIDLGWKKRGAPRGRTRGKRLSAWQGKPEGWTCRQNWR